MKIYVSLLVSQAAEYRSNMATARNKAQAAVDRTDPVGADLDRADRAHRRWRKAVEVHVGIARAEKNMIGDVNLNALLHELCDDAAAVYSEATQKFMDTQVHRDAVYAVMSARQDMVDAFEHLTALHVLYVGSVVE